MWVLFSRIHQDENTYSSYSMNFWSSVEHSHSKYSFTAAKTTNKNSVLQTVIPEVLLSSLLFNHWSANTWPGVHQRPQETLKVLGAHPEETLTSVSLFLHHLQRDSAEPPVQHLRWQEINENSGLEQKNYIYHFRKVAPLLGNFLQLS